MHTTTSPQANTDRRRTGFRTAIGVIVAVVLSLVGASVVASAADRLDISITTTFSPSNVTIQTGTLVTWTNNDNRSHELRSTSGPAEFRSNPLAPGQTTSFTFTTAGTYTYVDHQNDKSAAYRGTIVVIDGPVPVTPPPASTPPANTPSAPMTASVHLAGAQFAPATVTVAVGGTVTWTNDDASKHTVTADNGSFDSGTLNSAATFAHTFTAAGTYAYGCDFHGNMRGTVIVTGTTGTPSPTPTPPAPVPAPPAPTPPAPPAAPPAAPAPGSTPTNESVSISNNTFSPATITVNLGSTITWSNGDTVTHTVTAGDQTFTSGLLKKATTWSHTFATAGTFPYFCEIHPDMVGTVIAKASDGAITPAAPANITPTPAATNAGTQPANSTGVAAAAAAGGAATGSIAISDSGFTPATFRLALGGTLSFANNGKAAHTVTATDGSFDSDMIRSGGSWVHTFNTAGSFTYHCILHPNMKGTVQVVSSSGGDGNAAAATIAAGTSPVAAAETTATVAGSTATAIQPVNVDVADNQFNPGVATVAAGGTVTWKLSGEAAHTVTADDESFNSGIVKPGESFQFTFTKLGSFTYLCLIHPGMTGTINVVPPEEAAAQQATTPPAAAGTPPTQAAANGTSTTAGADPARDSNLWGNTLLGIAAVLVACCALIFALRSFLKILSSDDGDPTMVKPPTEGFTPHPV